MDCGVRLRGPRRVNKRCAIHKRKAIRTAQREYNRRQYEQNPELYRARKRVEYRTNPTARRLNVERCRKYRELERRIRGARRRLPPPVAQWRDRLAYRLYEDEGWQQKDIAKLIGLSRSRTCSVISAERERREYAEQERAVRRQGVDTERRVA